MICDAVADFGAEYQRDRAAKDFQAQCVRRVFRGFPAQNLAAGKSPFARNDGKRVERG